MTKKTKTKYKKPPQAPRRFKSAYMFFSTRKHKEIRAELAEKGITEKTTTIAKMVSVAWKELSPKDREVWDELASKDKARYEVEKSLYTGPWKVPAKKGSQKDQNAPKRPMSAFLAYSHAKRAEVKKKNVNMNNAEISRVLAEMWKRAPDEEKKDHIDKEYSLRQTYLSEIAVWRENTEKELNDQRKHREDMAMKTVVARGTSGALPTENFDPSHRAQPAESEAPPGSYPGYYPPPHDYYAAGGAWSQAGYGQEYRHHYPYYPQNPSSMQHYEPPPPQHGEGAREEYAANDQHGYPTSEHYGYYPPGGPPPPAGAYASGHEQYPPGSYGEYPPPPPTGAGQGYGSYYDRPSYPPPRDGEVYGSSHAAVSETRQV